VTLQKIFGLAMALLLAVPLALAQGQTKAELRSLGSALRVMQITAHPGDEDGALLLYCSHELGAQVTLLTLTRGERGDSSIGIQEPTEQGLLRTMEQLASDEHYGAEQRFTRVVDFGFARKSDEVFDRWLGHNTALGDMVRVIRETRPEIIFTPFDVNSPDGDGQHTAAAILVREAFRAAADEKQFPEQLKAGVQPWQAKRLFALARSGSYAVAFDAASTAKGESESWQAMAQKALDEQRSQKGLWHAPREGMRHYRLIDSAPGFGLSEGAKEFTTGLDVQLESLADGSGLEGDALAQVQLRLRAMGDAATAAESAPDRASRVTLLAAYLRDLRGVEDRLVGASESAALRGDMESRRRRAEELLLELEGVKVTATLAEPAADEMNYVLVPGANYSVDVQVTAGPEIRVAGMELRADGGRWTPKRDWTAGAAHAVFHGRVPVDAPFTRPHFLLESEEDGAYRILDERNATRALPPGALHVVVEFEAEGELARMSVPVMGREGSEMHEAAVAPPISVIVEPRTQWNRRTHLSYGEVQVRVRSNVHDLQNALLAVHPASGWRTEPDREMLEIARRGEEHGYRFYLVQERGEEGSYPVRGVVRWGSSVFDQGYSIVRGAGGRVAFDYRSSDGTLVSAEVEAPENLLVGYVGVPGDVIPAALRGLNVQVTELDSAELQSGRLERFWAIVVGPGALDVRDDLGAARSRLLRYEEAGGAMVILAQSDAARFESNAPTPYPVEIGTARVSNEASAVEILDPHHFLMQDPNAITGEDFHGWSEERGRNYAQRWDGHFEALLRMRDPGEPAQEGALIRARNGRGSVVYTGLSFSQQVSAGAPGALRLLVNLLSSGEELHH
jgi:LmbE family N-acetylglucosaminyl deacetylase